MEHVQDDPVSSRCPQPASNCCFPSSTCMQQAVCAWQTRLELMNAGCYSLAVQTTFTLIGTFMVNVDFSCMLFSTKTHGSWSCCTCSCAGVCHYSRGGGCRIRLSEPLLKVVQFATVQNPVVIVDALVSVSCSVHGMLPRLQLHTDRLITHQQQPMGCLQLQPVQRIIKPCCFTTVVISTPSHLPVVHVPAGCCWCRVQQRPLDGAVGYWLVCWL